MSEILVYLPVSVILFLSMLLYFRIAEKFNIVDKPNHRSSHNEVTLRGGGIIYWLAAFIAFFMHMKSNSLFFVGITLVSLISFIDDLKGMSTKVRFMVQLVALTLIGLEMDVFATQPIWILIIAYIVSIGIINAYNFMDGINGITGIYTFIVYAGLYYVNERVVVGFVNEELVLLPMIASLIFLFFNFRKKAKCFAGDIGSISVAFWCIFILGKLIMATNNPVWLCFLAVYGVDTVCTIFHRLYLKQNILEAHRLHFYQILCNENKIDHRIIASAYGLLQGIISIVTILLYVNNFDEYVIIALLILPLVVVYSTKFKLQKK